MTPERQRWWDSLPTEEKEARRRISFIKSDMQSAKQEAKRFKKLIPPGLIYNSITAENISRLHGQINKINGCNFVIKALRKQIGMRPIVFKYPGYKSYECPRCREGAITYLPHCSMCGQKLRWE